MKKVLFLCTGNSARSQMAEGLLRHYHGDKHEVYSAGVSSSFVNPFAIEAMNQIGIDISSHKSQSVNEFIDQEFDMIITVCDNAKESCPIFLGKAQRLHWSLPDPHSFQDFIKIRDNVKEKIDNEFGR